jgi:hypothetical protein
MSAVAEGAPKNEVAPSSEVSSAAAAKATFGKWLPVTAVAVGALLSVVWTASLLGLSVWALLLLV